MSHRAYQMFEGGQTNPQPANMQAIVAFLGLTDQPVGSNGDGSRPEIAWPPDVQVFLDMLGAYLMALPEQSRLTVIHDVTRQIFATHRPATPLGVRDD